MYMIELNSVEKLTEFLNLPKNNDWITHCELNLELYHELQFKTPLKFVRVNIIILEKMESIIKIKKVNKKEVYNLIRFNIFFGSYNVKQCREALEFLKERKYFKGNKIKSFQKKFSNMEDTLLKHSKKFANGSIE